MQEKFLVVFTSIFEKIVFKCLFLNNIYIDTFFNMRESYPKKQQEYFPTATFKLILEINIFSDVKVIYFYRRKFGKFIKHK